MAQHYEVNRQFYFVSKACRDNSKKLKFTFRHLAKVKKKLIYVCVVYMNR